MVPASLIATSATPALSFQLYLDDPTGFQDSLSEDSLSTIVDTNDNFASTPSAATNQLKLTRTGAIDGSNFSYDIYDVNFSNNSVSLGSQGLTPGAPSGTDADIDSNSNLEIETPEVEQDGASGNGDWGIDSKGTPDRRSTRNAAIFDFTATPNNSGIGHFGLYLHDLESDPNFTLAELRLYQGGVLIHSQDIDWGTDNNGSQFNGDGESHFLGISAEGNSQFFDQLAIVVGDDNAGNGFTEAWAADEFTFGQAYAKVPWDFSPTLGIFLTAIFWAVNQLIYLHRQK